MTLRSRLERLEPCLGGRELAALAIRRMEDQGEKWRPMPQVPPEHRHDFDHFIDVYFTATVILHGWIAGLATTTAGFEKLAKLADAAQSSPLRKGILAEVVDTWTTARLSNRVYQEVRGAFGDGTKFASLELELNDVERRLESVARILKPNVRTPEPDEGQIAEVRAQLEDVLRVRDLEAG